MNLSPSALLVIVFVVALTNSLIMHAVASRSRAQRARQFAEVDALLSASIVDTRTWKERPSPSDTWLSSVQDSRTAVQQPSTGDDEPDVAADAQESEVGAAIDAADAEEADVAAPEPLTLLAMGGADTAPFGRDALTGLLDAPAFDEALSHEGAREQRYGHPATVIVFELDGLAKLVDRLGPGAGDRIETALGFAIKRLARRADYVARLERGRYAALLPETDEVAAINCVERIRSVCDPWLESVAIAMRLAIGWASPSGDAGLTGAVLVATDRMRAELRRNLRQVGDETAGIVELDASQAAEVA